MKPIRTLEHLTPEWIADVLGTDSAAVASCAVRKHDETFFYQTAIVDVTYRSEDGKLPASVFLKIAREGVPEDLAQSRKREVHFYMTLLSRLSTAVFPRCYWAGHDDAGLCTLVLEDLSSSHCKSDYPIPPSAEHCLAAVECLARLHASWWDHPELQSITHEFESSSVISDRWSRLAKDAESFINFMGDRLTKAQVQMIRAAAAHWRPFADRYLTLRNLTFVHNDADLWHFFFPKNAADSVKLFDMRSYGNGIGAGDLATLIALHMYPSPRRARERELLKHYHSELIRNGVRNYGFEEFLHDYKLCMVRTVLTPVKMWRMELWAGIWYYAMERICSACEDWGCEELIERGVTRP